MKNLIMWKPFVLVIPLFAMILCLEGCSFKSADNTQEVVEESIEEIETLEEDVEVQSEPEVETPQNNSESYSEEEIPDQVDMNQLGDWYMSNEEYDEMVTNSDVGVGEN